MIRRPPRSTQSRSSAASDVYKRQDNMVNFGPLTAEIGSGVWGTLQISTGFASWQRYCAASSSGRQPNFAALNRGRHLWSAGRPSGWAFAHILVTAVSCIGSVIVCMRLFTAATTKGQSSLHLFVSRKHTSAMLNCPALFQTSACRDQSNMKRLAPSVSKM